MEPTPRELFIGCYCTTILLMAVGQLVFYIAATGLRDRSKVLETYRLYQAFMWILIIGGLTWITLT